MKGELKCKSTRCHHRDHSEQLSRRAAEKQTQKATKKNSASANGTVPVRPGSRPTRRVQLVFTLSAALVRVPACNAWESDIPSTTNDKMVNRRHKSSWQSCAKKPTFSFEMVTRSDFQVDLAFADTFVVSLALLSLGGTR